MWNILSDGYQFHEENVVAKENRSSLVVNLPASREEILAIVDRLASFPIFAAEPWVGWTGSGRICDDER
jgi:hypothetical protein